MVIYYHNTLQWDEILYEGAFHFIQPHFHEIIIEEVKKYEVEEKYSWNLRCIETKNAPAENISTHCDISCWQTDIIFNDLVLFYHGLENSIFKIWFEMLLAPSYHR